MIRNVQTDEVSLSNRYPLAQEGADESDAGDELEKEFSNLLRRAGTSLSQADTISALSIAASQIAPVTREKQAPEQASESRPATEINTAAERGTASAKAVERATAEKVTTAENKDQTATSSGSQSDQESHQDVDAQQTRAVTGEATSIQKDEQSVSSEDVAPEAVTTGTTALLPHTAESASGHDVSGAAESATGAVDSGRASSQGTSAQEDPGAFAVETIPVATAAQEAAEGGVKETKAAEKTSAASQTAPLPVEAPLDTNSTAATGAAVEASVRFAVLQKSVEEAVVKGEGRSASQLQASQGTSSTTAVGAASESRATSNDTSRAAKSLPKTVMIRTFERVENVLKEAAKSRDGKTLSFKLDPDELGQVKVDVSLRDGGLHARITPESQQVTSLLRERAHELQSSLRKLGLNVDSVTVTVNSESSSADQGAGQSLNVSTGNSGMMSDGKSFQDERNNMPGQSTQVAEISFGNELADIGRASKATSNSLPLSGWVA